MPEVVRRFWSWYERYYAFHTGLTIFLFLWQLVHLYWLATHVIALRLFGVSYFDPSPFWQNVLIFVDYTEVPALVSTSLLYLFELRRKFSWKIVGLLLLLNSQWLHLYWITDEFVLHTFVGEPHGGTMFPAWLAWVAILIDYLELPVIVDIMRRFFKSIRQGKSGEFLQKEFK